jgi:hypothetical protein
MVPADEDIPPDLAGLIEAWPTLPHAMRDVIRVPASNQPCPGGVGRNRRVQALGATSSISYELGRLQAESNERAGHGESSGWVAEQPHRVFQDDFLRLDKSNSGRTSTVPT